MEKESKTPPQVALPRDLHKILKDRSRQTNISMQRLVADALRVGMKIKQWIPEEIGN